ncbi:hypothetical protein JD77_00097 [Micromonospora olivasterospora]|uniref:Uncharacterized protein n=1 Tax=Micromonospora olivasterospora TaxID=1880 RepID=A0A562I2I4_MICOL|nr:hypothetical protein JD77_00097 [Micromonospora olivasterospora]
MRAFSLTARAISTSCCMPTLSPPNSRRGSMRAPIRASLRRAASVMARRSSAP